LIDTTPVAVTDDLSVALLSRLTPEIVIGLIGPVASGVTTSGKILEAVISKQYGYSVSPIRMSELIERNADQVDLFYDAGLSAAARIQLLQEVGSKLREKFGGAYLAAKAVEIIAVDRGKKGFADEAMQEPERVRRVHIIDSIKNQKEVELFRSVYGTAFWLVGVFAPKDIRKLRLTKKGSNASIAEQIMERDEHEGPEHGQDVRETFFGSDYFLKNSGNNTDELEKSVRRLLSSIFEESIITPSADERGMAFAKQAAASSACMSRQVGAVIVSPEQSVIGQGWNEVPRPMGGVYSELDGEHDARCFKIGGKICHNDDRKDRLYTQITNEFRSLISGNRFSTRLADLVKENGADETLVASILDIIDAETNGEQIRSVLKKTGVKSLLEFSRSVHAEMAAIVDVARTGRGGVQGSTMYVTTFPCHNCARHIIASGVERVVYIEPYPKSLAIELHDDAIHDLTFTENQDAGQKRVRFEPFEGVGPARYFSVFLMGDERKENGIYKPRQSTQKLPADAESLDAFATLEKRVIEHLAKIETK
tara:strand:+ start:585 stop:2198 length:1614 start_codon:yes stop_codon:yes gene_type:complete